jgi:AcrR family transcriptional regulator
MSSVTETGAVTSSPSTRNMNDTILLTASRLFSRYGYAAVGIRQLADEVGLTTSTLYHYYRNKQDILFAVIDGFLVDFAEAQLPPLADAGIPALQRLERAVVVHITMTVQRREELLVSNPVLNALSPEQRGVIQGRRRAYRDAVRRVVEEAVQDGALYVENVTLSVTALLDMLDGVRAWFSEDGRLSLEQVAEHYRRSALTLLSAGGE